MKKILILCLVILLTVTGCTNTLNIDKLDHNGSTTQDSLPADYSRFFTTNTVHELKISISETDWNDMLENPLEESYHAADIELDGITAEQVGIRTKGNSTLRDVAQSDSSRYSFKFKMNEYEDQKLLDLDEFVVNNMFSDASYLREYLSYEGMAAMGLHVPLASFVNIYVNDELKGLYLLVESVDDSFLNRNFGENDGNLYRGDMGTTFAIDDGQYMENANQKNGEDTSKDDLYHLMDILDAMPGGEKGDIESVLDVTSVLKYIATNTLLESYDSLSGMFSQNFYIYNHEGIFTMIPWDYNMAFGSFGGSGQSTVDIDAPVYGKEISDAPLIEKLLAVPEYKAEYHEILEAYMTYFEDFESHVTELADLIREDVIKDPTKFASIENFEANVIYQDGGAVEAGTMGNEFENGMERGDRPDGQLPPEGQIPRDGTMAPDDNVIPGAFGKRMGGNNQGGNDVSIVNVLLARMTDIQQQLNK